MYAEVIVNQPVEGTFHYHIPAELAGRVGVGHLVEVSFGPQKTQAVVLSLAEHSPVESTKPVLRLVDKEPVLSETQLTLSRWISETYWAPLSECVRLFIPPGLSRRGDIQVAPLVDLAAVETTTDNEKRLVKLLQERSPLRGRQIARAMPRRNWQAAIKSLADRGLIARDPVLDPPETSAKQVRVAELAFPPSRLDEILAVHFADTRRAPARRRAEILRLLAGSDGSMEVGQIYVGVAGSILADLKSLAETDLIILREREIWRDPLQGFSFVPDTPPALTQHQAEAWEKIEAGLAGHGPRSILLHGVTGSGKTELYLRSVDVTLRQGRSALILVPEIALTPQTLHRIGARFPGRLGLVHSGLSPGERYDTWRRARMGQFDVIVGPRSALFAPLANLGLIVIDECHDDSYKQSPPLSSQPQLPYYHAVLTAVELARLHSATVLMGSATPDVAEYARALSRSERAPLLITLPARIMGHRRAIEQQAIHYHLQATRYSHSSEDPTEAVMIDLPPVQVIDMRQELRSNNRSIFSRALDEAIQKVLKRDEQAILFLNRRGTATYVFCRACGHVLHCPRCDTPLTWHISRQGDGDQGALVCHQCSYRGQNPDKCPACGSTQIRYFGGGTERVEQEVRARFPDARVVRWDRDTAQGKDAHVHLLEEFTRHKYNVMVGTQMIAKGLDLPLVTLVGVINADVGLHLPDFRSAERTFQLLTQVAGRAGRGILGGEVIIQTYSPEHYAIRAASQHDFHAFYEREIALRRDIGYPPFNRLVRLIIRSDKFDRARADARRLFDQLDERRRELGLNTLTLIGPAPCFYARQDNLYRWQVIIRGQNPTAILEGIHGSQSLQIDVDPITLL